MMFEHISFRLTHPKDFELFSRLDTEGKLTLKGYELLPVHPEVLTKNVIQDKIWVQKKVAVGGSELQDVLCEVRSKGEILSPHQYAMFVEQMRIKYNGEIRPQTYEKYVEDMKTPDYFVRLEFNKIGTQQLAAITTANVNRKLAVIVDGFVLTAPVIREPILGGSVQLFSFGNEDQAWKIVKLMKVCREGMTTGSGLESLKHVPSRKDRKVSP
jgi:hypothetical protein